MDPFFIFLLKCSNRFIALLYSLYFMYGKIKAIKKRNDATRNFINDHISLVHVYDFI